MFNKNNNKNAEKPKQETFIITRAELRRLFIALGISENRISMIFAGMEKAHRHINAVAFAGILDRIGGLEREQIANVLRRIGMDDVTIRNVLNNMDEQKIIAESGRLFSATILFT
ncbi:MAG: hypothetical protein ACP5UN_01030 [Candidatus Micrarchaeia archaeon]